MKMEKLKDTLLVRFCFKINIQPILVRKTPLGISLSPFYAKNESSLREILENVIFDFPNCDVQICLPIENKITFKVENNFDQN